MAPSRHLAALRNFVAFGGIATVPGLAVGSTEPRADMRASMSLDLELGRPLELPWLAGAVIDRRAVRDILAIYVDGKPA